MKDSFLPGFLRNFAVSVTGKIQLSAIMLLCVVGLGYIVRQSDFSAISAFYGSFFLAYFLVLTANLDEKQIQFWTFFAIGLRVILLFALPALSDDFYRFIWDGRLLASGVNPYNYQPSFLVENGFALSGNDAALLQKLNSPGYFTVYPPVCQAVFGIAAWFFPNGILGATFVMKFFLLSCEIGTIVLIPKILSALNLPSKNLLFYALNPLIIIEICGNLHFEGGMIFFLTAAFWLLLKKRETVSAILFSLSVGVKLLPLIFLPFLWKRLGWKVFIGYGFVVSVVLGLLFLPFINEVLVQNFTASLDLYFQKFEFNGSFYYLLRWLGYQWKGYNLIEDFGPLLAVAAFIGIVSFAFFHPSKSLLSLPKVGLFAITIYLLCATTVHPWYLSLPVFLSIFTTYRFPLVWSNLVILTYGSYQFGEYREQLSVVAVEYLIVALVLTYELLKGKNLVERIEHE